MWEVDHSLLRQEVFPLFKTYIEDHSASKSIYPHFVLIPYSAKKVGDTSLGESPDGFVDSHHAQWEGVQSDDGVAPLVAYLSTNFQISHPKKRRKGNAVLKKVSSHVSISSPTVVKFCWYEQ